MDRFFGLLRRRKPSLPELTERIACLREVLHANNTALGSVTGIQEALEGERPISVADVRRLVILDQQTRRVIDFRRGMQGTFLRAGPIEGTERVPVARESLGDWVVTPEQAVQVADLAWRVESALGLAIDVEWAIDREGRTFVLQVRPLSDVAERAQGPPRARVAEARVLVEKGLMLRSSTLGASTAHLPRPPPDQQTVDGMPTGNCSSPSRP